MLIANREMKHHLIDRSCIHSSFLQFMSFLQDFRKGMPPERPLFNSRSADCENRPRSSFGSDVLPRSKFSNHIPSISYDTCANLPLHPCNYSANQGARSIHVSFTILCLCLLYWTDASVHRWNWVKPVYQKKISIYF